MHLDKPCPQNKLKIHQRLSSLSDMVYAAVKGLAFVETKHQRRFPLKTGLIQAGRRCLMDDSARSSVWADETDWLLHLMALKSARLSLLCIYFRYNFLLTLSSLRCLFTLSNFANLLSPLILPAPAMYPRVPLPLLRDKCCCLHRRADASTFRCVHTPP